MAASGPGARDPVAADLVAAAPVAASHQVVAIGSEADVAGLALAGVRVVPAATAVGAHHVWDELPREQVAVVLLTAQAAADVGEARWASGSPLSVVIPAGGPGDPMADRLPPAGGDDGDDGEDGGG